MPAEICQIEFLAGPLDGLRLDVPLPGNQLAERVAFPITENTLRAIHGHRRCRHAPPTSVAVYRLNLKSGAAPRRRYLFVRAFYPADVPVTHWPQ